jgi:hypothetical protein
MLDKGLHTQSILIYWKNGKFRSAAANSQLFAHEKGAPQATHEGVEHTSKFVRAYRSCSLFVLPFRAPFSCSLFVQLPRVPLLAFHAWNDKKIDIARRTKEDSLLYSSHSPHYCCFLLPPITNKRTRPSDTSPE